MQLEIVDELVDLGTTSTGTTPETETAPEYKVKERPKPIQRNRAQRRSLPRAPRIRSFGVWCGVCQLPFIAVHFEQKFIQCQCKARMHARTGAR